jgi:hypothetical protein
VSDFLHTLCKNPCHTYYLARRQRLDKVIQVLKNGNERDESIRWDCIWLAGEITEAVSKDDPIQTEIEDLMAWV